MAAGVIIMKHENINAEGRKDDQGKCRMELLPPEYLSATASVLTFGAQKYTKTAWENLWNALNPIAIDLFIAGNFAARITKSNSGSIILSMQNDSDKTDANGNNATQTKCEHWQSAEKMISALGYATEKQNDAGLSGASGLQNSKLLNSYAEAVKFAEASSTYTLITTIQRDFSEVFYAVSTTTAWDSLVITLKGLKPHLPTSVLNPETGDRNWEKGMKWSRVFGALMRHMWAWWGGQHTDPETGMSHLWHASCCLAFLIAYEQRKVGEDDRP